MRSCMRWLLALLLLAMGGVHAAPLEDFVKHDEYRSVSLSPNGERLAIAAPSGDQTGMVVLDVSDSDAMQATAAFELRSEEHVADIYWANNERILFTTNREAGTLYQPRPTGRIYGVDVNGRNLEMLFGVGEGTRVGRHGSILSLMPEQEDRVLIQEVAHDRPYPRALLMDVNDGRTRTAATSPLENGGLIADSEGRIRFAFGTAEDGDSEYAYREDEDSDWVSFDSSLAGNHLSVYGFAANNRDIFMSSRETGKMGLYRLDTDEGDEELLIEHDQVEVSRFTGMMRGASPILWDREGEFVIGAVIEDGHPEMHFIDPSEETSQIQRSIAQAFQGQHARVVSFARDADRAIVQVEADIAPAGWFLFNLEDMSARYLLSSRDWVDPEEAYPTSPIEFEARDGLTIPGYFTPPRGSEGQGDYPTIMLVHGGPHGPRDIWGYDPVVQLLAEHGYAVMQVNFRGSGGYGSEFEEKGYREWGAAMQDDLTDATQWAIDEGLSDPDRFCIYGGSYGGYAAVMGLVREPELYTCGAAKVGVFDLPLLFEVGDIPERPQGRAYLRRVLGEDEEQLIERSPARQVARIQAPLYISHGEEDIRAHVDHYHFLLEQLDEAEVPYESRLFENEGHGYYDLDNRKTYYRELLDFFDRHMKD